MKKLTFALFVAFAATMFVSCGPKIDTPENLGKSLIEALSSQDQEDYAELFMTKEEMLSLIDEAGKTQTDEATKSGLEEEKKNVQEKFDERVTQSIKKSYDEINKDATEEKINWEKVEFVSVESKEETNQFKVKILNARVYFKTENALNFYLDYSALQVDGDWKIVDVDGIRVKK
jgi:hypothetical protein